MMPRPAQADLFDWPKPRKRPAYKHTSREAYRTFTPASGSLDATILRVIEAAGAPGIICEHIEQQLGRSHQAVSGNLRHVVERGLVKHNGKFDLTKSRRKAMCWVLSRRQ
jgi:hypothetical protein